MNFFVIKIRTPPGFVLPTPPRDLNRHAFLYPNDAILDKKTQDVMIRVWIEPPITGIYCRVHELFPARFFHGLKEGDVLTLSLPNDVNLHLVLDQQNYRYSNHGKFEEVLHKFIFNSFNYSMDSEKGLILLKSLLDLGTSPRRLTEILKKDREDLIKCIETWLSTKCTSLTPKKRSCEDFERFYTNHYSN